MALPLYLKAGLAGTVALVLWLQFTGDNQRDALYPAPIPEANTQRPSGSSAFSTNDEEIELINLFAVPEAALPATDPSGAMVPEPPFRPTGYWESRGMRTIILSDEERSWLICANCRQPNRIHPGMSLTADWRLIDVKSHYLVVEWVPGHIRTKIELTSLLKR